MSCGIVAFLLSIEDEWKTLRLKVPAKIPTTSLEANRSLLRNEKRMCGATYQRSAIHLLRRPLAHNIFKYRGTSETVTAPWKNLLDANRSVSGRNGTFLCWSVAAMRNHYSTAKCHARNVLRQKRIPVCENCRVLHFSAKQCIAGTHGARSVHCTRAWCASAALYAPYLWKSGEQLHKNYTPGVPKLPWTWSLHYQCKWYPIVHCELTV